MSIKNRLYEVIFKADTKAGKAFDVALIISVLLSVCTAMLGSVKAVDVRFGEILRGTEWFFTILFTVEYVLRLYSSKKTAPYAVSFFGIIDLLAIIPTYLELFIPGARFLLTIRIIRVLRIFRVFKLAPYIEETRKLAAILKASARRILVFLLFVFTLVVVLGSLMYIIEDPASGFTSIPRSIYWAIVTLTTVGYGDISPQTPLGQGLASLIMILGYSLIVVPTGFVSVAIASEAQKTDKRECPSCGKTGHAADAQHCKYCGKKL